MPPDRIVVRMDSLTNLSTDANISNAANVAAPKQSFPSNVIAPRWCFWSPMSMAREGASAVAVGSDLYLIGGYCASKKFLNDCCKLNTDTRQWADIPAMNQPRMGCAAIYSKETNQIYVVGGFSKRRAYLNTVEVLDLRTMQWSVLPPMTQGRAGCAAVAVPQGIVVLGGWMDSETATDTVELFSFETKTWSRLPNMSMGRAGAACLPIKGFGSSVKIMVMGGHFTSQKFKGCRSAVEVLDLDTKKWTKWRSMKEKRDSAAACVVGQCVFVMGGGETSNSPTSSVEVLSLETKKWSQMSPMQTKRFACTAVAVRNRIVVVEGRGANGEHLDSVESIEIPLLDPIEEEPAMPLSEFLVEKHTASSSMDLSNLNRSAGSMVDAVNTMMEADKATAKAKFDNAKNHVKEQYERVVKVADERLKVLEEEKKRLLAQKAEARKKREDQLALAEQEKREAFRQIEAKFRPLVERAMNSSSELNHSSHLETSSALSSTLTPPQPPHNGVESQSSPRPPSGEEEPPDELCCCITGCLMDDPVTAMDGHTYERSAIEKWYQGFPAHEAPTSPMTNERLPSRRLIPSHNMRSQCKSWLEKVGKDSIYAPNTFHPSNRRRSFSAGSHCSAEPCRSWTRVGGEPPSRRNSGFTRTSHQSSRVPRSASMIGSMPPVMLRGSGHSSRPRMMSGDFVQGRSTNMHPAYQGGRVARRQSFT
jgi:N-acetylneuraminic acid mutarotase